MGADTRLGIWFDFYVNARATVTGGATFRKIELAIGARSTARRHATAPRCRASDAHARRWRA
jgi:hypothetical protein